MAEQPAKLNFTLMIVEDEENVRNVFADVLRRRFEFVLTAENGLKGLDLYKVNKPDIIITDIRMPEMDGLTMAREIRNINPNVSIIVLSAYDDIKHLLLATDIGIEAYVSKPIKREELLEALDKAILKAKRFKV